MADIIRHSRKGARKTQIVFGANLNFDLLNRYLPDMQREGLVEIEGHFIRATEKGKAFMRHCDGFRDFGEITVQLHW